jgi:23S rRNA (guanosine2251-2'-O)-methyltransferase
MKGPSATRPARSKGLRKHGAVQSPKRRDRSPSSKGWIWGWHAVEAVLANPRRTLHELFMTEAAERRYAPAIPPIPARIMNPHEMDNFLPSGAVHQGLAVKAAPLEWPDLSTLAQESDLILILDQITDPHNVGAMLRLASAFGAGALIMQDRNAPPLSGATAKVAVGCLETVPTVLVTNIADTLQELKTYHYQVTGLAGDTELSLQDALHPNTKQAIVMGAEGPGLRPRVAKTCDRLARIPMQSSGEAGSAESLNVATAAAIALYEVRRAH